MGISSKKVTSKTTPYNAGAINSATNALSGAYTQNAPKVQSVSDNLTGLVPGMIDKFKAGNPALNAANDYVTSTLGGNATNPHLDQWISQTQDDVSSRLGSRLSKLGLGPAGTSYQGLQSRELGKVALGARMDDWNAAQGRKAQAAGMAPGLAAGEVATVAPMLATAELGAGLPMQHAAQYAAGTGGLLSPYATTTQKQSGGLLGSLLGAGLAGWASGGFKF